MSIVKRMLNKKFFKKVKCSLQQIIAVHFFFIVLKLLKM